MVTGKMGSVSGAVISAVARKKGVTEQSLTLPLHEAIDPDALDALFDTETSNRDSFPTVKFRYNGYNVVVNAPEDVEVQESTNDQ
ncbi:HalOD1 output domain-containing protein [Halorarius litoreus]|uniref:HalOD1 output domain-containing protein n=1 Tax=Halorarius litoreus TaxID=2962676 RepID=UPI0020CFB458|nr:HalOD1 output domain-containing protein [Halorarius litoreus]